MLRAYLNYGLVAAARGIFKIRKYVNGLSKASDRD